MLTVETKYDDEAKVWVDEVSELPGAIAFAPTIEEAVQLAESKALYFLAYKLEVGDPIPEGILGLFLGQREISSNQGFPRPCRSAPEQGRRPACFKGFVIMMKVTPVPCLRDNYAYLIEGERDGFAAVVDPSESAPVQEALSQRGLRLEAILATHHHQDHVGGIRALARAYPSASVVAFGGDAHRIEGVTRPVYDGDSLHIVGLSVSIRHIPGHTLGAIAYVVEQKGMPAVAFTGDTLFVGGCGRLFEGTPEQMHHSLVTVLGSLPDSTELYVGHEYTEANLRFAASVEPNNKAIRTKQKRIAEVRARGGASVPSTIGEERETNPFLRCHLSSVKGFANLTEQASEMDIFACIRRAKDMVLERCSSAKATTHRQGRRVRRTKVRRSEPTRSGRSESAVHGGLRSPKGAVHEACEL